MDQLRWLADYDPKRIDEYLKTPLWEYWTILDHKLAVFEKEKSRRKK